MTPGLTKKKPDEGSTASSGSEPAKDDKPDRLAPLRKSICHQEAIKKLAANLERIYTDDHPDRYLIDRCAKWLSLAQQISLHRRAWDSKRQHQGPPLLWDEFHNVEGELLNAEPMIYEGCRIMLEVATEGLYLSSMEPEDRDFDGLALPFVIAVKRALASTHGDLSDPGKGRF